jgi:hypothetical protein
LVLSESSGGARLPKATWAQCGAGPVVVEPLLNPFFGQRGEGREQTRRLSARIAELGARKAIMVTHQVNMTALTGTIPASGEIVVAMPSPRKIAVVGRIGPGLTGRGGDIRPSLRQTPEQSRRTMWQSDTRSVVEATPIGDLVFRRIAGISILEAPPGADLPALASVIRVRVASRTNPARL